MRPDHDPQAWELRHARLRLAQGALRALRDDLNRSPAAAPPRVLARLRALLKSVDGAVRHADGRRRRAKPQAA